MALARRPMQPLFRIMRNDKELSRFHSKNVGSARAEMRRQVAVLLRRDSDARFWLERFGSGWLPVDAGKS